MKTPVKIYLILFLVLFLSTAEMASLISNNPLSFKLVAQKLPEAPTKYFVVTDPDAPLLQAISRPGESIPLQSRDETAFDHLREQYGTNNIKYQDFYYSVGILIAEPRSELFLLSGLSLIGLVISIIALISYTLLLAFRRIKKQRQT